MSLCGLQVDMGHEIDTQALEPLNKCFVWVSTSAELPKIERATQRQ